ncbi:MAG: SIS domain-containing protein [Porticoccaceae bacterium]
MDKQIFTHFQKLIETTMVVGDALSSPMAAAAEKIAQALLAGNTIFSCGDKSAVPLSQLFADYLAQGFEIERPGFPALNINKLVDNSFGAERYAQTVQVQGNSGDVILVVSAGDNSLALLTAIEAAIDKGLNIILLSAVNDDLLSATLGYNDVIIPAAEFEGQLATAAQFQIIQCLCAMVDHQIFGGE